MRTNPQIIILAAIFIITIQAFSAEVQHWNDLVITGNLTSRTSLEIYNRSRWCEIPFTKTFQNCLQGGFRYNFNPQTNAMLAYRYDINDKGSYYEFENRFFLQFSYKTAYSDIVDMQLTQRTEFRYFTRSTEDHIRVRIRSTFSRDLELFDFRFTPSLSGELFWDDIDDEVNRTRLYLGIAFKVKPRYTLKLDWIHQTDKDKEDTDILNSGIAIGF